MTEFEALRYVPIVNEAIRHTPQQALPPAPIVGKSHGLANDTAMVWVVTHAIAYRFIFDRSPIKPLPRLRLVQFIGVGRPGGLKSTDLFNVPGNVADLATTLAFIPLKLPETFQPWRN
jgi:hypothetical protein